MLYRILHFLVRKSLSFHYEEIKAFKKQNIPKTGPLLIASTHPNSFLDALIIATKVKRPLHFLARSDVFENKLASYILRKLQLIPIYRLRDGSSKLKRNEESFKACHEVLNNGGAILIFAEGLSVSDKQIRPLKKGLARIAFGYYSNYTPQHDLNIIACGINYEHIARFGSKVLLGFSDVIPINDLLDKKIPEAKSYKILNQRIKDALSANSILVKPEDEDFHQALVELDPGYEQNSLRRKSLIAEKIIQLKGESPETYLKLKGEVLKMAKILKPYKLDFQSLKHRVEITPIDYVIRILIAPLALIGFLLNYFPFYLGKLFSEKFTIKEPEFYLSVRFATATVFWLIYSGLLSILLGVFISYWFLLSPIALFLLFKAYRTYKIKSDLISRLKWIKKMKANPKDASGVQLEIRKILELRSSLGLMLKV